METTLLREERLDSMREIAIQEKDVTLQWSGGKGRLVYVKLKKAKTEEARINNVITPENIHEIARLTLMKNNRAYTLKIDTEKTTFRPSGYNYSAPVFYINSPLTKAEYEHYFSGK